MPNTKIDSNKNTFFGIAPISAFVNPAQPTLAELAAVTNLSEAVKWDGYDFGREASEQDEDRALTDSAGASTRGYENFGGNVNFFTPKPGDTTSIERIARNMVSKGKTQLVIITRDGLPASAPFAAGQVINTFHVITDARSEGRGDKNRFYTVNFRPKGKTGVNYIIPSAVPTAVVITGAGAVAIGAAKQLRAVYENNDITIGAKWRSDSAAVEVTPHGWVIRKVAGNANISATYPGSAAGTSVAITV